MDDESGAVLILVAVIMVVLLGAAALVIDIAAVRTLRINQQSISDASAAAGALTAGETGIPRDVCEVTKSYVEINADAIVALNGIDCSAWSAVSCDPGVEAIATDTQNGITVQITYPVTDASPLMSSSAVGAVPQPASAADGLDPCERVGVEISSTWHTMFGRLAGVESVDATVHTVARSTRPAGEDVPINLLVLDRTGCQALLAAGNGGILVAPVVNPDLDGDPSNGLTPGLEPGVAAADSDASSGCVGVIDLDGSNSIIQADGPAGCGQQLGSDYPYVGFAAGAGCGQIQTLAPGTPGCNLPACSIGGGGQTPLPDPTALPNRLTRAPIDHRFNCKADYTTLNPPSIIWATDPLTAANEQDIPPCPDPANGAPHIHNLINLVKQTGTPPGFQRWTTDHDCVLATSDPPLVLSGDWHVDCALNINSTVIFNGGNVVFDGDVSIQASGTLAVNTTAAIPADPSTYSAATPEAWVFLRDGVLKKAGQGSLYLNNTTLYVSKTSTIGLAGGTGTVAWIAPNQGDFDDLALWSDSPDRHKFAGQATLTLEGTFFAPLATIEYTGNGSQSQVRAQFISHRLHAGGNGALVVAPEFGRAVAFPTNPTTDLIR
jgi:hypothetical protein